VLTVTEPFASPLFANIEPLTTIYQGWPVDLSDHPNGCWLMVHSCPAPADAGAGPAAYAVEIQAAYTSLTKDGEAGVLGWIHVVKCNSNHKNNYFPGCYELEVNEAIPATTILLSPSPDLPIHALWEMDPSRRQAVGDLIRHAVMCRSARGFDAPVSPPPGSKTAPPEEIGIKAKCGLVGAQTKAITAALLHKEHFSDAGTHANRYTRWDHTPHIYEEATIHGIAIGRPYTFYRPAAKVAWPFTSIRMERRWSTSSSKFKPGRATSTRLGLVGVGPMTTPVKYVGRLGLRRSRLLASRCRSSAMVIRISPRSSYAP
jgi:hypothetical protein